METGIIYKVTNIVNNKIYIGQTRQPLYVRRNHHIQDAKSKKSYSCPYFHSAIHKYGKDNFTWEIIQSNINVDQLDDKEKLYIAQYRSNDPKYGYNLTAGGNNALNVRRLDKAIVTQIRDDILDTQEPLSVIASKYGISLGVVQDISCGKSYHDSTYNYPLRGKAKHMLEDTVIADIVNALRDTMLSYQEIAKLYDTSISTVMKINLGRINVNNSLRYPIRDKHVPVSEIVQKLQNTTMSLKDIAQTYNVSMTTVRDINHGKCHKQIGITYPIRTFINTKRAQSVIQMLKDTMLTFAEIAVRCGCLPRHVQEINRGATFTRLHNLPLPIRVKNSRKGERILTDKQVNDIVNDLLNSKLTIVEIGQKYKVRRHVIKDINRGATYRNSVSISSYPIRTT